MCVAAAVDDDNAANEHLNMTNWLWKMRNWCRLQKSHTACRAFSVCCYIYFRRSTLLLQFVVCSRQACIMPQRVCVFANMPPAHHIKNSSLAPISASDWYAFWSARRIISQKTAASLWCRFFLSISCITCSLPVSTRRAHNKRTKTNKKMPKEKMFLTDCGVCAMNKFSKYACISVAPLNWTAIGQVWQAPFCPIVCCRSVFGVPWSQCDVCLCVCICVSVQCTGAFGRWRRRPTYTAISAAAVAAKCMYCMPNYTLVVVVVVASCTPQRFGPQAHSRFFFHFLPDFIRSVSLFRSARRRRQQRQRRHTDKHDNGTGLTAPNDTRWRHGMTVYLRMRVRQRCSARRKMQP